MAFTTGTTYTYTDRMFKRGTIGLNLPATLAPGYNWFNGVDVTSSQYLIYSDTYTTGIASQANSRPTAWTTPDKTDASLLGLINTLPERVGQTSFTNVTDARTWLQESNRYFLINSGYEDIVTDQLLINLDANWYNSYKTGNTTWNDISGNFNNATLTNSPAFDTRNGGSVVFDGADDYGNFGNLSYNRSNFSVFAWVNYPTVHGLWDSTIASKWYTGGSNGSNNEWSFGADGQVGPSPFAVTVQYAAGGSNYLAIVGGPIYSANTWYHVGFTWTGGTLSLYVNGVMVASGYTANSSAQTTTQPLAIASFLNLSTYCTNMKLGSFLMYNKALSQTEILKNYNTQKGRYGFDNIISSGLKLNLNSQIPLSYTGGGNSFYDLSGNNNTGTLTNGPTFDSITRSIVFDGTDDYVVGPNIGSLSTFTVDCWFYPTSNPGNSAAIITDIYTSYLNYVIGWGNSEVGSNTFFGGFYNNGWVKTPGITATLNQWWNLTLTFSDGKLKFYSFGNLYSTTSTVKTPQGGGSGYRVGRRWDIPDYFIGKIPNVKIYNRALTETEVLQNYYQGNVVTSGITFALDAGNLVSYGGTGTSWKDLKGTVSAATLINGVSYSTLNNGALVFDGTDDYATAPSSSDWAFGANGTVSMWAYFTGNLTANHRFWCTNNLETYLDTYLDGATGLVGFHGSSTLTTTLFPRDQWVNLTVTYIGGVIAVYYNGVPQPLQGKTTGYNISNTGTLFIGQYAGGGGYTWRGRMSTMFTYNIGLSAMEVQQNFNAHRGRYGV
jgi:hypothetical protein